MAYSKKEVRKLVESRRLSLDERIKTAMDQSIFGKLIEHSDFINADSIFIYISFDGEIDTHKIINYALDEGKMVCVPKIFTKDEGMQLMKIDDLSSLTPGYYGILEPAAGSKQVAVEEIDLIIMPGLAFDADGNRVGYGGGFYDRLLASKKVRASKIALAYEFQIFNKLLTDKWDQKVDKIITDKQIISCR